MPQAFSEVTVLESLHIRLFTTHCIRLSPGWKGPFNNNFWRLYVNSRGGAQIWTRDVKLNMLPRRVYIIPAWVQFEGRGVSTIDHCYAHFELMSLPATVIRAVFNQMYLLKRDRPLDELVAAWMPRMIAGEPVTLDVLLRTKAMIYVALAGVLRELSSDARERCAQHLIGRQTMTAALEYIEAHLAEPIDNTVLGRVCHVSRDHLIRLFRQQIGQTPAQFILERRVSKAAQQLIFSADSIEQIAERHGFLDRFHFSRMFKARMGTPPATYRKTAPRY